MIPRAHDRRGWSWVIAQGILGFAMLLAPRRGPEWSFETRLAGFFLALPLAIVGAWLMLAGALYLGRSFTPLPRPREDGQLVRTGLFRVVRHPIYAGAILLAWSWTLLRASLLHAVIALAIVVLLDAKARREERWLVERYPEYRSYQRQVARLIPWLY
ncbi:MAG: isoprenylcysteine carboxylmethyltransferase family protein [Chloroflexi bacterium]|nr:isoprenylcysteine carboxylmethyltransferase family protein [Chloroflexota bacterium]